MTVDGKKSRDELIRERERAQSELLEHQQVIQGILETVPGGVVHVRVDGSIAAANEEALRILGLSYDEITKRYTADFDTHTVFEDGSHCSVEDYPVTKALVTGEPQPRVTIGVRRPDGQTSWAVFTALPLKNEAGQVTGAVVTFLDITQRIRDEDERDRLRKQLEEAGRLEAVGRLSGGIAHDFNNLLTVIQGGVDLLERRLKQDEKEAYQEPRALGQIRTAAKRAAALTRQLLAFGRRQVLEPRKLDLNHVVANVEDMLRRVVREDVNLVVDAASDLGLVRADASQVERVLLNLLVNARDAMPDGGTVTIRTSNVDVVEGADIDGVPPGRYVVLEVIDSGVGIDDTTQARIFEPFFTTKGDGTGLGLSSVHGIVVQSGGHIRVRSAVGRGTTFRVLLPRVFDAPSRHPPPLTHAASARDVSGTILLVEDNDAVRSVTSRILRAAGYDVREAARGDQAIEQFTALGAVDLLVSDVVMPDLSGPRLAEALLARDPSLKVLFISGHAAHAIEVAGLASADVNFLPKPFSADALMERVGRILGLRRV